VLGDFLWPGLAFDSRRGQIAAWINTTGNTNIVLTMNDSTLSAPVCTANTFSNGPPYVDDSNSPGNPLTRGVLGRFAYNPVNDVFTTVNDATTQAFVARLVNYTATDVDYSNRLWVSDPKLFMGLRRGWNFDTAKFYSGPTPQGESAGGHAQNHSSQGFPSPTIDTSTFTSLATLHFVQGPSGFDSSGGEWNLNACGYTDGPDMLGCSGAIQNPGDEIFFAFEQYMDSNTLNATITTSDSTTQGQKQFIFADVDVKASSCPNGVLANGVCVANACSDDEQVLQNVSHRNIPGSYFMCGSPVGGYDNYNTFVNGVGIILQNGTGNAQTCIYPGPYSEPGCPFVYRANEWAAYQIHLKLGLGGYWNGTGGTDALTDCPAQFKNSVFDLYAAHQGAAAWTQVQHYNFCWYNPSGYPFGKMHLLDFLTNFTSSSAAMNSWDTHPIMSTTLIPAPGATGGSGGSGGPQTAGCSENLTINPSLKISASKKACKP
jgi:hypothetical protein